MEIQAVVNQKETGQREGTCYLHQERSPQKHGVPSETGVMAATRNAKENSLVVAASIMGPLPHPPDSLSKRPEPLLLPS